MSGRMIHPSIAKSESLAGCTFRQRLLFVELIALADDQGRQRGHAGLVRSAAFPFDDLTNAAIDADLDALAQAGCIMRYQVDGRDYLQIPGWWTYQHPQWAGPSQYPPPPEWIDRHRYHRGPRHEVFTQNWRPESPTTTVPPAGDKGSGVPSDVPLAEEEVKEEVEEEVEELPKTTAATAAPPNSPPPAELLKAEPAPTLKPTTPAARVLFARLGANAQAKRPGARGPTRFGSLEQKTAWETTEAAAGHERTIALIEAGLGKGITDTAGLVGFVVGAWKNNGKSRPPRASPAQPKVNEPAGFAGLREFAAMHGIGPEAVT